MLLHVQVILPTSRVTGLSLERAGTNIQLVVAVDTESEEARCQVMISQPWCD